MDQPKNESEGSAANFLRAKTQHGRSEGARGPKSSVYLSWGGQIYGPSSREDVIAGIRTSWFEEETLYWYEGLEEWKPVYEFPDSGATSEPKAWQKVMPADLPAAPILPAKSGSENSARTRSRRSRFSKPSSRRLGRNGRVIFLAIAVLAVLLIVGILLLLMEV